ncbi:MAG: cytochrome c, partial [Nitrospirales bacterium]
MAEDPIGITMRGESVNRTNCLNCHGVKGQGNGPVVDSLTLRPADLTTEIVQKKSENELLKIIREGKPGTSMPSWKGEL